MTTTDVGPFRLVDPPAGQEDVIRAAIDAIDYPWDRLAPALANDPDGCVIVEWDDTGQGTSGLFYGYSLRIVLSTRVYHMDAGAGFVFAHEVGHLVDRADLRDEDRQVLMELMHSSAKTHRFDGQQMNGTEHPLSHQQPHDETWVSANDYLFRHNEAYADLFVEAFAPTIWDGSFYPGAPSRGPDWLRFVHTTDDLESVIRLTLWTPPTPDRRDEDPAVRHAHMTVVGGNVRNNPPMPSAKVRQDYDVMAAMADVAMVNECGRPRYRRLLRRAMPRKDWAIAGLWRTDTPIAVRRKSRWRIKSQSIVKLHGGEAKVTPTRKLLKVVVEHLDSPGLEVELYCTHLVSGAWNQKRKFRKLLRKRLWRRSRRTLEQEVRSSTHPIVFFADLNKRDVEELGIPRLGEVKWVAGRNNIVKLGVRPTADTRVKVRAVEMIPAHSLNTDHPFIVAKLLVSQED